MSPSEAQRDTAYVFKDMEDNKVIPPGDDGSGDSLRHGYEEVTAALSPLP
jgi:hypothetical protein